MNTFLPMYPLKSLEEAKEYLAVNYLNSYERPQGYRYAICLREDSRPIGYMNMGDGESHDFGYGLAREYWHRGIAAEAGKAVIDRMREDGVPYITATHDVRNPASGRVMKKLGMTYRYSYEEQWQPKDIRVTFRMYQLNLDSSGEHVYRGYWERYPVHFVEENV